MGRVRQSRCRGKLRQGLSCAEWGLRQCAARVHEQLWNYETVLWMRKGMLEWGRESHPLLCGLRRLLQRYVLCLYRHLPNVWEYASQHATAVLLHPLREKDRLPCWNTACLHSPESGFNSEDLIEDTATERKLVGFCLFHSQSISQDTLSPVVTFSSNDFISKLDNWRLTSTLINRSRQPWKGNGAMCTSNSKLWILSRISKKSMESVSLGCFVYSCVILAFLF